MGRFPVVTLLLAAAVVVSSASAREPRAKVPAKPVETHDLLAAEAAGLVTVKYIPNDSRSAQIVVTNRSDRPLALRMPEVFAGVPVLAQFGVPGGMPNNGNGGFGAAGAPQVTTGAQPMNAGMGIGGPMGGAGVCWVAREVYGVHDPRWLVFRDWLLADGPAWLCSLYGEHGPVFADWIHDKPLAKAAVRAAMDLVVEPRLTATAAGEFQVSDARARADRRGSPEASPVADGAGLMRLLPEKTRVSKVTTVCVEYGKPEPSPLRAYKLVELSSYSADARLEQLMRSIGRGEITQKVAQAAAWHIASGLTWERLAAEKIDHAGGVPDEPYFTPAELEAAFQVVAIVTKRAEGMEESSRAPSPGETEASIR